MKHPYESFWFLFAAACAATFAPFALLYPPKRTDRYGGWRGGGPEVERKHRGEG